MLVDVGMLISSSSDSPTGMSRVLAAVVGQLFATCPPDGEVELVRFDHRFGWLTEVTRAEFEARVAAISAGGEPVPAGAGQGAGRGEAARGSSGGSSVDSWSARLRAVPQAGALRSARMMVRRLRVRLRERRGAAVARRRPVRWGPECVYLELVLPTVFGALPVVLDRRDRDGGRVVVCCHDVFPLSHPQHTGERLAQTFERYFQAMMRADVVLSVSQATTEAMRNVAHERGLNLPPVVQMPNTSGLDLRRPGRPPEGVAVESGCFVLAVGTLSPRKNYALLADVWEEFVRVAGVGSAAGSDTTSAGAGHGAGVPPLVVVGGPGWMSDSEQRRLTVTPGFADRVWWLPDLGDEELIWLYRNCAFGVVPSLTEGWGLPIAELLTAGKVCLCSGRGAMVEAAQGVCELLDPLDRVAWGEAIMRMWTDIGARQAAEARVRAQYRPITVEQMTDAVLRAVDPATGLGGRG